MPEPLWLVLALLPLAALSGWWAAARTYKREERRDRKTISSNYFRGLNYLLNEQPDKAIEVFLKLAEINTETAETHLALGNLFRRRGEVDKAIRFHQHIIGRSNLSEQHRTQALLELGEDYMCAGLLDRAEKLFSELADDGRYSEVAIGNLLSIYQQEKDWKNAIVQARKLGGVCDRDTSALIAQFHCELAVQAKEAGERENARRHLASARSHHAECVRAWLLDADLDLADARWESAGLKYQQACQLDPDISVLVVDDLARCFAEQGREPELLEWLERLVTKGSTLAPVLACAAIRADSDPASAIDFLLEHLQKRPTARGLYQLLELMHRHGHRIDEINPELLRNLMHRLLADQPRFRCRQCGFSGHTWHWQCPSCREWETTRPVVGVLGE
ncbi:MAG: lipopolysaccharide assembly protein LapB [Wenzhouxiangellaceae bacterium]|nr:lipopolysaccharide assembly protein LapB [Wenzhouxiangellaceae bacterium]MBS3746184.1 lipopolysaccharide assembly protein LapB [Wenzhouxiangellaceae bacterium]MBS3822604.1 lipopolysaccharide assembly protein LapB [Wenzhouxiangellaceae bacterium]